MSTTFFTQRSNGINGLEKSLDLIKEFIPWRLETGLLKLVPYFLEMVSIATPERYGIAFIPTNGIRNTMVFCEPW
jgi:hypothetical protein